MTKQIVFKFLILLLISIWGYFGSLNWLMQKPPDFSDQYLKPSSVSSRLPFSNLMKLPETQKDLDYQQFEAGFEELRVSKQLEITPFFAGSWLALADIKYRQGDTESAISFADKAEKMWPTSRQSLYSVASFWLKIGDIERSIIAFGKYLATDPANLNIVLSIASLLENDTDNLVRLLFSSKLITEHNQSLLGEKILRYAIKNKSHRLSSSIWKKFATEFDQDKSLVTKYISFLIENNKVDDAISIWNEHDANSPIRENVVNSSFESDLSRGGFGWEFHNTSKVNWMIDSDIAFEGKNSLKLEFSGNDNVHYANISQVIPVESGASYTLSAYWRGQNITTRSTPFIELQALHSSQKIFSISESLRGNWSWQKLKVKIIMPSDSNLLKIRVRRNRTKALDKNIEGSIWFDDFKIEKEI